MSDGILAVPGKATRAAVQSADILLGEAPSVTLALAWIAEVFARYPGCLVAAVRHDGGAWCAIAARDRDIEVDRPSPGRRLDRAAAQRAAHERYERIVRS
jgi:hypothetical protein